MAARGVGGRGWGRGWHGASIYQKAILSVVWKGIPSSSTNWMWEGMEEFPIETEADGTAPASTAIPKLEVFLPPATSPAPDDYPPPFRNGDRSFL